MIFYYPSVKSFCQSDIDQRGTQFTSFFLVIVKLDEVWWSWTEAMRGFVKWFQNLQQMQNCWARICSLFCQLWSSKKQSRRAFSRPVLQWLARTRCTTSPLNSRNTGNSTKLLDRNTLRPRLNGPYPQPKLSTQQMCCSLLHRRWINPVQWGLNSSRLPCGNGCRNSWLSDESDRSSGISCRWWGSGILFQKFCRIFKGENCEMPAVSGAATSQSAPGMELTLANQWVS